MVIVASPYKTYCSCSTVLVWRGIPPPLCIENFRNAKLGPSCEEIRTWLVVSFPAATFIASTSFECLIDIVILLAPPLSSAAHQKGRGRCLALNYGVPVFVGQGVYVGAMGSDKVGRIVMVDKGVCVDNGVFVRVGVGVMVGVGVEFPFRPSRPRVKTAAAPITRIIPAMIPMIQGIQFTFFRITSLKLGGTAINTTVMLSCPPRELASSISAREASFKLGRERIVSRISSFQTRSVRPSLHKSKISLD